FHARSIQADQPGRGCLLRQRTRSVEARVPEPFVYAAAFAHRISLRKSATRAAKKENSRGQERAYLCASWSGAQSASSGAIPKMGHLRRCCRLEHASIRDGPERRRPCRRCFQEAQQAAAARPAWSHRIAQPPPVRPPAAREYRAEWRAFRRSENRPRQEIHLRARTQVRTR